MGWTQVVINRTHLAENARFIRGVVKGKLYAVVKSNAYGHGLLECSRIFLEEGADALAVFFPQEGRILRKAGIDAEVLLLGGFWKEEVSSVFDHGFEPAVGNLWAIEALEEEGRARRRSALIHVKIDTGMGRLGFLPGEVDEVKKLLKKCRWVKVKGVMSHLPSADEEDEESRRFTLKQIELFREILEEFRPFGYEVAHIANSSGALFYPEAAFDGARVGIALYGGIEHPRLKQAMSVRTRLISVRKVPKGWSISYGRTFTTEKPTVIGIIPSGYATGYTRVCSNKAQVSVNGRRCRVLGRVCMDLTVLELNDVKIKEGDWVYLLGGEGEEISVHECARWMGTITYEVFCLFSLGASSVVYV